MNALYFIVTKIISLKVCKIVGWKNSFNGISIVMIHGAPSYRRVVSNFAAGFGEVYTPGSLGTDAVPLRPPGGVC